MPSISNRGLQMPASPIRRLTPYAEAAKRRGVHVYHLNIGQPDIETPPSILDAVRHSDLKILAYSHSAGNESYRQKLTEYYSRFRVHVDASQIIVTTGGSEAILFGLMSCLDPGDEVIIPEPFYANYNGFAMAAQVQVKPVTSGIDRAFALPREDEFRKLITPKTRAILICNPNNPTGYLYTRQELEVLKQLCIAHDLYLFSDEAYREFCYEGAHFSAMNLEGMDEYVVLFDTISKRYSACGARLGALVSKNATVISAVLKFAQARLSPPTFAQILGEAAVNVSPDYFQRVKKEYHARRDLVVNRLNSMEGVKCPVPGGAFYAMAGLPVDDADHFCQWLLEKFSYEDQTVMLAPASGFYATAGLGKKEVRLAYVLNQNELEKAMTCLENALVIYPGREN